MPLENTEPAQAKANDVQVAGNHYRGVNADYQHWDMVADVGMGYFDGQITKYVSRWEKKNGLQDLEKSRHFAIKYKEVLEERRVFAPVRADSLKTATCLNRYLDAQGIVGQNAFVVIHMTKTHGLDDVKLIVDVLTDMVNEEKLRVEAESENDLA